MRWSDVFIFVSGALPLSIGLSTIDTNSPWWLMWALISLAVSVLKLGYWLDDASKSPDS